MLYVCIKTQKDKSKLSDELGEQKCKSWDETACDSSGLSFRRIRGGEILIL